jgi:hypothetical protein
MLTAQFSGHGLFQKALKDAFTEIVNRELPVRAAHEAADIVLILDVMVIREVA